MFKILSPVISEFKSINSAVRAGRRLAKINNQSIFKGAANGIKQVHKHTGTIPLITGAISGASFWCVPGTTSMGIVAGIYLKKLLKVLKFIR